MKMPLSAKQLPKLPVLGFYRNTHILALWKIRNKLENIIITQSSDPLTSKRLYSQIFKSTEVSKRD